MKKSVIAVIAGGVILASTCCCCVPAFLIPGASKTSPETTENIETTVQVTTSTTVPKTTKTTVRTTIATTEKTTVAETTESGILEDLIRPEVKEVIDSYEAFMDEYISFMERYNNASTEEMIGMMTDYFSMLERYTKAVEKFENMDDGELTTAESLYYAEVSLRVYDKLMKASIIMGAGN